MSVNRQLKPSWQFYFYSAPKRKPGSDCHQSEEALHVFHHISSPGFDRICVGEGSKSEGLATGGPARFTFAQVSVTTAAESSPSGKKKV